MEEISSLDFHQFLRNPTIIKYYSITYRSIGIGQLSNKHTSQVGYGLTPMPWIVCHASLLIKAV